MADDSIEIIEPFDYHPCNSPRGMLYYDLNVLTSEQQTELNKLKRKVVRDDEKYLAKHPEVRAVVALVTRQVLKYRPRTDLPQFIGSFFSRPKVDIEQEIRRYIQERELHKYEGDSAVIVHEESSEEGSELVCSVQGDESEEEDLGDVPRKMLDEILHKAYQRLGINIDDKGDWEPPTLTSDSSGGSVVKSVISEILKRSVKEPGQEELLKYLKKIEMGSGEMDTALLTDVYIANSEIPDTYETTEAETTRSLTGTFVTEGTQELLTEATQELLAETTQELSTEVTQELLTEVTQELLTEATQEPSTEATQEFLTEATQELLTEGNVTDQTEGPTDPPQTEVTLSEQDTEASKEIASENPE